MRLQSRRIVKIVVALVAVVAMGVMAAQASARFPERPDTIGAPQTLTPANVNKKLGCQAQHAAQAAAARAAVRWNQLGGNLSQAIRRSGIDVAEVAQPVQLPIPAVIKTC